MTDIDTTDTELLDELGIVPTTAVNRHQRRHPRQVAKLSEKEKQSIRRGHHHRRRILLEVCRQHGLHTSVRLLDAIVHFQEITDLNRPGDLAYPSQMTLARHAGWTTDDTVRKHLHRLEEVGILARYVPRPTRQPDGTYTRATTRYHLRDRVGSRLLRSPACPIPQRHRRTIDPDMTAPSPTPNNFGDNPPVGGEATGGPVDKPPMCAPPSPECDPNHVGAPQAHPTTTPPPHIGPPWRDHPGGYTGWLTTQR